ncbi:OsmC family protein [Flexibacterium corallicola]|uniref:OsmC family protein n=1 Tax=Flexibacterium corallicola TaxID=3037259 RepID=UPI00286F0C5F|nr:OsmC family protein [Pseudovibrio sp. M1P-2-3]
MSDHQKEAIVTKLNSFPKTRKIEIGQPQKEQGYFHFEVNLAAQASMDGGYVKQGAVQASVPGCSAFEIRCDEGGTIGGTDSAPPPLSYLAAGIAFCFLSHVSIYIKETKLDIKSIKIEQQMRFTAAVYKMKEATDAPPKGLCDGVETYVFIESDEPREKIERMMEVCKAACMGLQTVTNAVPASMTLVLCNQLEA